MEDILRKAIADALVELEVPSSGFVVEHPGDMSHGDYATNAAFVVAKQLEQNPRELAAKLKEKLEGKVLQVEAIEVAGPGFLNFKLRRDFFSEKIAAARSLGTAWGTNTTRAGEHIAFEYTSPNLFKPLHIGNLVGNIIGESLTRLLEASGAEVKRFNYPSDIGPTVAKGVWGLMKTGGDPSDILALGEAYRVGNDAYENDEALKKEIDEVNKKLYEGLDAALGALREQGLRTSRARLAELCAKLGTHFDFEIPESEAGPIGVTYVEKNLGTIFEESEGAVVYKGEKHGLHTRVFMNSKGFPTYEAKDLGNFARKLEYYPSLTQMYIVTGVEQAEYFKVLFAALREVFPAAAEKGLQHIPTGFLTLTTGKMSSRKGNVLTGESLIVDIEAEARAYASTSRAKDIGVLAEQVAVAALKYQILRQAVGSNIIFDKAQALLLTGDSGLYIQYAHARAVSLVKKAGELGIVSSTSSAPEAPYLLEKILYQFPEVVERAATQLEPHHLVTYMTRLAGEFNTFYAVERIADQSDNFASFKLALTEVTKLTLQKGLELLGMSAPEEM